MASEVTKEREELAAACFEKGAEWSASRITELQEALSFYADPGTYFAVGFFPDPPCGEFMDDFTETELGMKPGARARKALGWDDND